MKDASHKQSGQCKTFLPENTAENTENTGTQGLLKKSSFNLSESHIIFGIVKILLYRKEMPNDR